MTKTKWYIVFFIIILSGFYFISLKYKYNRPAIETKFVQNIKFNEIQQDDSKEIVAGVSKYTPEVDKPDEYAIVNLPSHTYQTFNNCGPATLSMILSFWGKKEDQNVLADQMRPYQVQSGDNDDKTIFTFEFSDWAKQYGLESISGINGDIDLLKTLTANGIPVVVKTWLHVNEDIGHFRIVTGFDQSQKVIIQDDSYEGPNRKISYFDFLSMWQPFNYNYIIVFTSDKKELVDAIIGSDPDTNNSWEKALIRANEELKLDPDNIYAAFNVVTSQYHLGNYELSIQEFEKIETKLPRRMLWYQIEPILSYYETGNYNRVFDITNKILENGNRAFSELYMIRGDVYKNQEKVDLARQEYEKAIFYNKNLAKAKEKLESL